MSYIYLHEPNSISNGSGYLDFLYRAIFINLENMVGYLMNQADRKEFDIIHLKIDDLRNDVVQMRKEMKEAHDKTDETFEWLRKDIFNPKEGLWAETTENTRYRKNSQRWRSIVGMGLVALIVEKFWSIITGG